MAQVLSLPADSLTMDSERIYRRNARAVNVLAVLWPLLFAAFMFCDLVPLMRDVLEATP